MLVRYADDAVMCFVNEQDARRVLEVLPRRFGRFGLELHPTKTRLVNFTPKRRFQPKATKDKEGHSADTFTFLGFTHYWGRSRRGYLVVKRKTASDRLSGGLKKLRQWCRRHRHDPVSVQRTHLAKKLKGHYAYYGITGNGRSLHLFYEQAKRAWLTWLSRRSQKARLRWDQFCRLLDRYPLPPPRVVHSIYLT